MKLSINLTAIIFLLFYFTKLQAQTPEQFLEFAHSGTVTTQGKTVKVPFEIWNDVILLKVKINNHNATFIWDNGFSISGIDTSLVKPFQFLPYGDANSNIPMVDGNNAKIDGVFLVCPKIELKGIAISNTPFIVFDSKAFTLTKKLKVDGIIGSSIINKLNWRFNFDKNYLEISMKPFAIDPTDLVLPFKIAINNNHVMDIAFNGMQTECLVDFGCTSDGVEINKIDAKHFSNAKATRAIGQNSVSVSGLAPIDTIHTIKDNFSWELAGKKLDFRPTLSFSKFTPNVMVGNKIFRKRYNVILNTSNDTVYALSSRTKPDRTTLTKTHGYLILLGNGKFRIAQIISNANTADNTLRLNDEVASINGKKPSGFKDNYSLIAYQKKLIRKERKIVLKLANGEEISLIPEPSTELPFKNEAELW